MCLTGCAAATRLPCPLTLLTEPASSCPGLTCPSTTHSYVSGPSGHILEVDVQRLAVQHARRLLPNLTPGSPSPHRQTFSSGRWCPASHRVSQCGPQPSCILCTDSTPIYGTALGTPPLPHFVLSAISGGWHHLPLGSAVAIYSLSIQGALCAVGSEDGLLRLWPLDFSSVLLEAGEAGTQCRAGARLQTGVVPGI